MEEAEQVQLVQGWVSTSVTPKKQKKGKKAKRDKLPMGFTPNTKKEPA